MQSNRSMHAAGSDAGLPFRKQPTPNARGLSSRHPQRTQRLHVVYAALAVVILAALLVVAALPVAAQQTTTAPTASSAGIAPLLEEDTVVLVVIDLDKIDFKALSELVNRPDFGSDPQNGVKFLKEFHDAEAAQAIISVNLSDLQRGAMPLAVLPNAGADLEPLRKLLANTTPVNERSPREVRQIGDLLVIAPVATLKRVSKNSVKRPDLEKALAAGGDAAIKIVFALPDSAKATIEEVMPTLPPELGGGDSSMLSEGLQWGVITVQSPPKMSAKGLALAKDKESAAKLKDFWIQLIKVFTEETKITPRRIDKETFDKLVTMITPQVKDSQLTIDITQEQADFVFQKLLVPFFRYEMLWRERSSRLKNLDMLVLCYVSENKNRMPDDFGVLLKDGHIKKEDLKNPVRPDLEVGYTLVKLAVPLDKLKDPSQTILIYEAYKQWGEGIFVAIADGHVEFVSDQKQFEDMLKKSTSAPATAPAK